MQGVARDTSRERIDLSENSLFFLELLETRRFWRERLVGEMRFAGRNHVRLSSSYQIDLPPELVERFQGQQTAQRANLLLPLVTRPKRQLLNFSLSGPGGCPATLTSRASIAALQAEYLKALAETSVAATGLAKADRQLYESICLFTPDFFRTSFLDVHRDDFEAALAAYLSDGLGWNVLAADIARWRKRTVPLGELLAQILEEPYDSLSSSDEILLALPLNPAKPSDSNEIGRLVNGYCDAMEAAARDGDAEFLAVLAEYGRRYEMIVEVEVPLLEPSRIKVEEDLPLEIKRRGVHQWVEQTFSLGDARSVHLEARVDDPSVEVADFEFRDLKGNDATPWLESVRRTREALATYTSNAGRPRFATVWIRLGVARPLMTGAILLTIANLAAIVAIPLIELEGSAGDRLAVLAIPTTIAATFALVRDQTGLASRLQWLPRFVLALTTLVLWIEVVLALYLIEEPQQSGGQQDPSATQIRVPVR